MACIKFSCFSGQTFTTIQMLFYLLYRNLSKNNSPIFCLPRDYDISTLSPKTFCPVNTFISRSTISAVHHNKFHVKLIFRFLPPPHPRTHKNITSTIGNTSVRRKRNAKLISFVTMQNQSVFVFDLLLNV